ncbi:hypothetical protein HFA01_33610 [Halobacillus faecis]|uniref:Uncharacterized protein n=1 Tax=Halobacillus faecis TaxID=360184 RepID=A0A511WVH2_9BACI|nr:hypothetical protein HFA01_33610 [Halobacillus faecis]
MKGSFAWDEGPATAKIFSFEVDIYRALVVLLFMKMYHKNLKKSDRIEGKRVRYKRSQRYVGMEKYLPWHADGGE